jgi:serine/threonine protein kinase
MPILARLFSGWRSDWFEAEQPRLSRRVALKCLRPEFAADPVVREGFFEAGRRAAMITHPASIPIINLYPGENRMAFELARGKPLRELAGSLPPFRLARMGEVVMDCLAVLHATGRSHGCLSPGNIFLDGQSGVWLTDFFQPPILAPGGAARVGWPDFTAPEILAAAPAAEGWRADIFSLGKCLAFASGPDAAASGPLSLAATLAAADPARRGETPQDILAAFREMRLREEKKAGIAAWEIRRGRRLYRRVPTEFDTTLRRRSATPVETASLLSRIRDIDENGIFVGTGDELIGVGSILELDFSLRGTEDKIHAFGVVRWMSSPPNPKGAGVQFVEVDRESLAKLRNFLASERNGRRPKPHPSGGPPANP